jgi:hypothetical protein
MKNAVLWNAMPCDSCKNRQFVGKYRFHHQGTRIGDLGQKYSSETSVLTGVTQRNIQEDDILCSVVQLLSYANVVLSLRILVTLMMEEICSSEKSLLTRGTQRNIPRKNLKSYLL